jgi:hypothetical protein
MLASAEACSRISERKKRQSSTPNGFNRTVTSPTQNKTSKKRRRFTHKTGKTTGAAMYLNAMLIAAHTQARRLEPAKRKSNDTKIEKSIGMSTYK